jgi:hypothetical protein
MTLVPLGARKFMASEKIMGACDGNQAATRQLCRHVWPTVGDKVRLRIQSFVEVGVTSRFMAK